MADTDNTEGTPGVHLHLQEAESMQKEWFTYALDAIQKLSDKQEATALSIQKERESLIVRMVECKEQMVARFVSNNENGVAEGVKINNKLDRIIRELSDKLVDSENKTNALLKEFTRSYDIKIKAVTEAIQITKDDQLITKTKVRDYVAMTGLIVTAIITTLAGGALVLFKDSIKAWIGS
jgi:hypothetical protein